MALRAELERLVRCLSAHGAHLLVQGLRHARSFALPLLHDRRYSRTTPSVASPGCGLVCVDDVQTGAEFHQHLNSVDRFILKGAHERDPAEPVLRVGVGAVFEQDARKIRARVRHAGVVQRGVADDIRDVWRCAVFEEVFERAGVVQRVSRL